MRRFVLAVVLSALAGAGIPAGAVDRGLGEPGPGYFATDNVEWITNIPVNTDSAGARVLDDLLYITDDRGLTIYDVSEPEAPVRRGFTPVLQTPYFVEEDPDTNGEILLISTYSDLTRSIHVGPLSELVVVDVTDPDAPAVRSTLAGAQQHTWSCVLDCTYGYGNLGLIADLRDPDNPRLSEHRWTDFVPVNGSHDVTEVAPGIVLASSNPLVLMDVRDNPEAPRLIARGDLPDGRFIHGNLWPNGATDRWALVGGETVGDCSGQTDGAFMTFDASDVDLSDEALSDGEIAEFTFVDEYRVFTGLPTEGDSPYNQYCAHWFTEHPDFADGGLVAMGWYEHGVRFLDISDEGEITEVGYFLPVGGSTSAAYWVTDEIVYTADYQRGIDVLRFTGEPATDEVTPSQTGLPAVPAPATAGRAGIAALDLPRSPYSCPLPGQ